MPDGAPKSAFEIAMERLRQKDAQEGIERRPLTDDQKAEIGEIRNVYEARLAEAEVMHRSELLRAMEPAARDALDAEYRRSRERLVSEREAKIERVRQSS